MEDRFAKAGAGRELRRFSYAPCPGVTGGIAEKCLPRENEPAKVRPLFKEKAAKIDHRRLHPSQRSGFGTHGFGGYEIVVLPVLLDDEPAGCLQGTARFEHPLRPGVPDRFGRFKRLFLRFAFSKRCAACALALLPKRNRLIPCHAAPHKSYVLKNPPQALSSSLLLRPGERPISR